jgi:type II secretory pathway pseudopilin PulG
VRSAQSKTLKKGFTLLELLVVMAIMIFVSTTIGAGILYLQNSVRLDNAIRTLKAEIQNTQSNARNSFVAYTQGSNPTSQSGVNFYTQRKLNIGWMMEVENLNNSIRITKRSVYLDTAAVSDQSTIVLDNLRERVKLFKDANTGLYCNNDTLFNSNGATTLNLGNSIALKCSTSLVGEYTLAQDINGAVLETTGINSCGLVGGKYNLFFTAGYGEPSIGTSDCQMRIKNTGNFGINTRAIRVDNETATATVCGKDCFTKSAGVIEEPAPTIGGVIVTPISGGGGGGIPIPELTPMVQ